MITPKPTEEQEALEAPRNDLDLAMQMLSKVLDNPPTGLIPDELLGIKISRARQMLDAATTLYNKILGRRTR